MPERRVFDAGLLAGILAMIGAQAIHWFITPIAHDASTVRNGLVAAQAVVGFGAAAWLIYRYRPRAATTITV